MRKTLFVQIYRDDPVYVLEAWLAHSQIRGVSRAQGDNEGVLRVKSGEERGKGLKRG